MSLARTLCLLTLALPFSGCVSSNTFTHLRASNYRDEVIAEWTARGRLVPLARGGYNITAVERISGPPHREYTRYPDGWRTTVQGAHIWHWECPKPAWLAELEGDPLPGATTSKRASAKPEGTHEVIKVEARVPATPLLR